MKEFAKGGSTDLEQFFGYRLSSARMVVECAFGRLKARFGVLRKPIDMCLPNTVYVIMSCFILHNFCEAEGENIGIEKETAARKYEREFEHSAVQIQNPVMHNNESGGKKIRTIFMKYFE